MSGSQAEEQARALRLRRLLRPLAGIPVLKNLPERARRSWAARGGEFTITDFDGDLSFRCFLDSHISSHVFWSGAYSRAQLALLHRILRPGMVFCDVGANEGEHTVFAAKRVRQGHVYAFEPSSKIFDRLCRNVELNGFGNVTLVRKGLGESARTVQLYGSTERSPDGTWNEGRSTIHHRPGVDRLLQDIELTTLDEFVDTEKPGRLDILKIDVEGAELAVLKGARKTLSRFRPGILIEVLDVTAAAAGHGSNALLQYLDREGYRFQAILRGGFTVPIRSATRWTRDVLCLPR